MKKILLFVPVIILFSGFVFNKIIDQKVKSLLEQVKLSEEGIESMIFSNCSSSSFYYPNPRDLKNLASGEKAALVPVIGKYIKEFTASPEFMKRYLSFREERKPREPEKPKSMDEMKAQAKKEYQQGIENMKITKKSLAADQQAMFDESIKMMEEQLKSIDDPDNPMYSKDMENLFIQSHDQQIAGYKAELELWEEAYPANTPSPLIKKWLANFLESSKDVDFNAKIIEKDGKKLFANSDYERKSSLWKLCFRTGKESTEEGRKFAMAWLNELK